MVYIEGIGDEVVITLAVSVLLIIIVLVWISTFVNERVHRNVIVIDRVRFEHLLRRLGVYHRYRAARASQERTQPVDQSSGDDQTQSRDNDQAREQSRDSVPAHPEGPAATSQQPVNSNNQNQASFQQSAQPAAQPVNSVGGSVPGALLNEDGSAQNSPAQNVVESLNIPQDNSAAINGTLDNLDITSQDVTSQASEAREGDLETMRKLRVAFLQRQGSVKTSDVIDSDGVTVQNNDATVTQNTEHSSRIAHTTGSQRDCLEADVNKSTTQPDLTDSNQQGEGTGNNQQGQDTGSNQEGRETCSSQQGEAAAPAPPASGEGRLEGHIRVKLRYLNERQTVVQARPEDTLDQFKRRHFASELAENLRVRLIYNGQELRNDGRSLHSYNILDNSVVHCLLSSVHLQQPQAPIQGQDEEFDIGTLVVPLFGFMLAIIWYCRFQYKQYFNVISTISLIGITFLFVVAFLASRRRDNIHEHQD